MNKDTRVAVCCYAGDQHQVVGNLNAYLHHGCPVTILSPEDSQVVINHDSVTNRFGGKRAYIGQDSLDREAEHLRLLLEFPENHFLIHDSDSVSLDAKIPDYLYAEPDILWNNQVNDPIPDHQAFFPDSWPHVAFQAPYFLSRKTIEALLAVKDDPRCKASPMMPFIDFYMVQLAYTAGVPWKRYPDCVCCGPGLALGLISHNISIYHGIKDPKLVTALVGARRRFLSGEGRTA
jgi:hypothetical protein